MAHDEDCVGCSHASVVAFDDRYGLKTDGNVPIAIISVACLSTPSFAGVLQE